MSGVCLPAAAVIGMRAVRRAATAGFASLSCRPALGAGSAIPSDHGSCGIARGEVGEAVTACASGHCNAFSNTCALTNGLGPCADARECASNVCGADGQCGRADGTGPCAADTASVWCRSGACSASGVCIPALTEACWVDTDCGSTQYCDRASFACRDKLEPGAPLPRDHLHDRCPDGRVNAACALGSCNPDTSTCAGPNLTACTSGAQCIWNACDPEDQRCGFARGGACDAESAAQVCRSGACQPSGVCLSAGPCKSDTDCAEGDHCDPSLRCAPDLANGQLIQPVTARAAARRAARQPRERVRERRLQSGVEHLCGRAGWRMRERQRV